MKHDEAEAVLSVMLRDQGVDPHDLDLVRTWDVFKRFAVLAVEDVDVRMDGDQLLFNAGVRRRQERVWSGDRPTDSVFQIAIDRQFYLVDPGGEYLGMNALSVTIQFELVPTLRDAPTTEFFGCGGPPWTDRDFGAAEEWIARVEDQPAFQAALTAGEPLDGWISQGAI